MPKLSISKAWDESRAILKRDGKLIMTVAAALFLLPQVVAGVVTGPSTGAAQMSGTTWLVVAVLAVIGMIGQLSLAWLAIRSGVSVGEAIRHGTQRFPAFFGAALLIMVAIVLFTIVATAILAAVGAIQVSAEPDPGSLGLILLVIIIPILLVSIRFLPSVGVATVEDVGPLGILKRSWALSRGHFMRLLGFIIIFLIAALIISFAMGAVAGAIVSLVAGRPEPMTLGALILALITGLVQASLITVYVLMLARIYTQLAGDGVPAEAAPTSGT